MDSKETGALVASVLSALGIGASLIFQGAVLAVPVFLIVLTAGLSFYFARVNAKDTRKYEIRRFAIDEALGPIYGEVLRIQEGLDSLQRELGTSRVGQVGEGDVWSIIRHSHRFFVIQEPLRSVTEAYFSRVARFNREQHRAYDDIFAIERQVWPKVLEIKDVSMSAQFRVKRGDELFVSNLQASLFWGVNPNSFGDDPYNYFNLQGVGADGRPTFLNQMNIPDVRAAIGKAWNLAFPEVERSPWVIKIRKDRADLVTETTRLRLMLEEEFAKWAS